MELLIVPCLAAPLWGRKKGVSQGKAEQEGREKKEKNKLRNQSWAWGQSHTEKNMQGGNWTLGHGVGKGTEITSISLSRGRGPGGVPGHLSFLPGDGSALWGGAVETPEEKLQGGSTELYRGDASRHRRREGGSVKT